MYWACENHTFNARQLERLQQHRCCNEPHPLHVLFAKVASGTTFTSWSKHHFVVIGKAKQQVHKASHCGNKQQWRSHVVLILFLLVRATWVLFFMHIPFVVNRTFNTVLTERLQHLHQGWARPVFLKLFYSIAPFHSLHVVFAPHAW